MPAKMTYSPRSKEFSKKEMNKLVKRLQSAAGKEGGVGFFEQAKYPTNPRKSKDKGDYDRAGSNVAAIAYANNYGGKTAKGWLIPSRPFFTLAVQKMAKSFDKDIASVVKAIYEGGSIESLFRVYLSKFEEEIKYSLLYGNWKENSKLTEVKKGFNLPLVRTGLMYDSIKIRIKRRKQ